MHFSLAATAALVAGAAATGGYGGGESDATQIVTAYTTYCPEPTTISHGSQTHIVTEPTYVTFTDCPVSTPMITETITECNACPTSHPIQPTGGLNPTGGPAPSSSTPLYPSGQPTPSQPQTSAPPPEYTGAASRAMAGAGAGLAGVLGVAAFVL